MYDAETTVNCKLTPVQAQWQSEAQAGANYLNLKSDTNLKGFFCASNVVAVRLKI